MILVSVEHSFRYDRQNVYNLQRKSAPASCDRPGAWPPQKGCDDAGQNISERTVSAIPIRDAQFDSPAEVMATLTAIERDLANRQNAYESAARDWYQAQREIKRKAAHALLNSTRSSVAEKRAEADEAAYDVESSAREAEYEALKAVIRVLEQRSMICMAILKSQGRA